MFECCKTTYLTFFAKRRIHRKQKLRKAVVLVKQGPHRSLRSYFPLIGRPVGHELRIGYTFEIIGPRQQQFIGTYCVAELFVCHRNPKGNTGNKGHTEEFQGGTNSEANTRAAC